MKNRCFEIFSVFDVLDFDARLFDFCLKGCVGALSFYNPKCLDCIGALSFVSCVHLFSGFFTSIRRQISRVVI